MRYYSSLVAVFFIAVVAASAETITVNAQFAGSYNQDNSRNPTPGYFIIGNYSGNANRGFFTFALPAVSGTIDSATFTISGISESSGTLAGQSFTAYYTPNSGSQLACGETGADALCWSGAPYFSNLEWGPAYGSGNFDFTSKSLSITFNAAGLSALSTVNSFTFGVGLDNASGNFDYIFGGPQDGTTESLTITTIAPVPEPSTLLLIATGMVILAKQEGSRGHDQ